MINHPALTDEEITQIFDDDIWNSDIKKVAEAQLRKVLQWVIEQLNAGDYGGPGSCDFGCVDLVERLLKENSR